MESGEGDRRLKYKKAAREDEVTNKVWKYGGKSLRRATWEEEWYGKDGVARDMKGSGDNAAEKKRARG